MQNKIIEGGQNNCFRDNVEWNSEQEESARKKVAENCKVLMNDNKQKHLLGHADQQWDSFYSIHTNRQVMLSTKL